MTGSLLPLDGVGHVAPLLQTRIACFLASAHGALARQYAFTLPLRINAAWQTELNAQFYRESEIVSLLLRATRWTPDMALPALMMSWEIAWAARPVAGIPDQSLAVAVDLSALAHAVHGAVRPAALLPVGADAADPFVTALRRVEFESGRLLQGQIAFLKGPALLPFREAVGAAVERRHDQVRHFWSELLEGLGIDPHGSP